MNNFIMTIITVLTVPLALLNFGSGIIGAGWLFFGYGEWHAPLYAFIVSLVAPFALSFPLMLSLIFAIPAIYLIKKGFFGKVVGFPFLVLSGFVTWSIIAIWGMWVFDYATVLHSKTSFDMLPYLLLAYSVATSPWSYMASKEPPENSAVAIPTFFNQIAAAVNIYNIGIQKADVLTIGITYIGIMVVGFIISLLFGLINLNPQNKQV